MNSKFSFALMLVVLGGFFFEAQAAPNYTGTWNYKLKVVQNTCGTTPETTFSLDHTQSGVVASAVPHLVTGTTLQFSGVVTANGVAMAARDQCPVVPDPTCSPDVTAITMYHGGVGRIRKANVTYVYHKRASDNGSYECSIYLKGTARKERS